MNNPILSIPFFSIAPWCSLLTLQLYCDEEKRRKNVRFIGILILNRTLHYRAKKLTVSNLKGIA